jgi:hypothetical protein
VVTQSIVSGWPTFRRSKPAYISTSADSEIVDFAKDGDPRRRRIRDGVARSDGSTRFAATDPFLDFPIEVRKLIYTTNGIESLNARFRHATRRRGHFRDKQSALKVLYLACIHREHNLAESDRTNP